MLANKQDLAGALPYDEIEACMHLSAILDRPWNCVGCSALRGSNIAPGLAWLSDIYQQRLIELRRRQAGFVQRNDPTTRTRARGSD